MRTLPCCLSLLMAGCVDPSVEADARRAPADLSPPPAGIPAPIDQAICEVQVDGVGLIDMESDYLPHVITCENGGAELEALKAQAIAARSVAYWTILDSGSICDGQGCQVYSCGAEPNALAYQAVEETAGQYLLYNGNLTYAFYVAGDSDAQGPSCEGTPGASSTEQWVTYNEGLSDTAVIQTELGFVHDPADAGYGQNRGCMSQWSSRCLENELGRSADEILRFFYGADITVATAQGDCVPSGDGDGDGDGESASSSEEGADTLADDAGDASAEVGSEDGGLTSTRGGVDTGVGTAADDAGLDAEGASFSGSCECRSQPRVPTSIPAWILFLLPVRAWRRRRHDRPS